MLNGDKMKRILIFLLIMAVQNVAQNVVVVEDIAVTSSKDGAFYYPLVSPNGKSVLFSSESYKGLWAKNLTTGKTIKITNATGAGYEPSFSSSSNEILYREDKFTSGKRYSSLLSYNPSTNKSVVLDEGIRDLKIFRDNMKVFNNYMKDAEVKSILKQSMSKKTTSANRIVFMHDSKIVLSENNIKKFLEPLGQGNYIWASLSPDKTKILFTLAGRGTFVSDINGAMLKKIGYANYPSWSPDGNWILFMKDIDDGIKVISSDIYIANLSSGKYFNLTSVKTDITMFPQWGVTNTEIFYNTNDGQIRKITLKYE